MRSRFLLVPAALVASSAAQAQSHQYLTVEESLAALFPRAQFAPNDLSFGRSQMDSLLKVAEGSVPSWKVTAWRVSTGGWAFLDQVPGRDDAIQYIVAVNDDGTVRGVEILQCLPEYDAVRGAGWLAQFIGRGQDSAEIFTIISGATLSSEHIAKGIRRMLITYNMFFAQRRG